MTSGSTSRKAKAQAAAPRRGANKAVIAAVVAVAGRRGGRRRRRAGAAAAAPRHPARARRGRRRPAGRRHRPRRRHRGQPRQGQAGAPTLDLYEDFQCPICGQLEKLFGAQIRCAWPRPATSSWSPTPCPSWTTTCSNDSSLRAANAAACAADAGRFRPVPRRGLRRPARQGGPGLHRRPARGLRRSTAGITGSALSTWQQCVKSGQHTAYAKAVQTQSEKDGVFGTPTLKLNGKVARPAEADPRVPHRTGQGRDDVSALTACRPAGDDPEPRRRASGTSASSRSGPTRCASWPASSSRSGSPSGAWPPAAARRGRRSTSRPGPCRSASSAAGSTTSSPRRQPYFGEGGHPSTRSRSGRAASASGAPSRSARSAPGSAAAGRGAASCASPTRRPGHRGGPGHRPLRQLVQQRALRRADRPAVGPADPPVGPGGGPRGPRRGRRSRSSSARSSRPSSTSRSGACVVAALLVLGRAPVHAGATGRCSRST